MTFTLYRSKRKTISLAVKENGSVVVRAPMRASILQIETFVVSNSDWLSKQFYRIAEIQKQSPKREFNSGEVSLYFGSQYVIETLEQIKKVQLAVGVIYLPNAALEEKRILLKRFYAKETLSKANEKVKELAAQMNVNPNSVQVGFANKLWGVCTPSGDIRFSWRLSMAPYEVFEYVVIHELAHLRQHNHSKSFWKIVGEFDPNFKAHRKWLRQNGHKTVF